MSQTSHLKMRLIQWLESVWYGERPLAKLCLMPLSLVFCAVSQLRRELLQKQQHPVDVPVVVIGNLAVGGTGKTPLTIKLAQLLTQAGYQVGLVSRGYGGHLPAKALQLVQPDSDLHQVGDEAILLVLRTQLPLVIASQRTKAIEGLLAHYPCDVVLSDDGLQHYRMVRDLEIIVLDGLRRLGNGACLPAGPLREPPERLQDCDFIITNGEARPQEYGMQVQGQCLHNKDGEQQALIALAGQSVHVVSAIGNPQRFLALLDAAQIHYQTHLQLYPDHYLFQAHDVQFDDVLPVLMTEKDFVKCRDFAAKNLWYLSVEAQLDLEFEEAFLARVAELVRKAKIAQESGVRLDS